MATKTTPTGTGIGRAFDRRTGRQEVLRRMLAAAAAALTIVQLTGCAAGSNAETSREVAPVPGAEAQAGPIALQDLVIPFREGGYPVGSDAPLVVRMFSTATQPVRLSRVTPGAGGTLTVPARTITLRQSGQAPAHNAGSGNSLTVPPGGYLLLVPGSSPYLVAEHITAPLPYGASVPIRVTFSTGDSVDVDVPMAPPTYPWSGTWPPTTAPASSTGTA